jgi:hypothetical protein
LKALDKTSNEVNRTGNQNLKSHEWINIIFLIFNGLKYLLKLPKTSRIGNDYYNKNDFFF